MCKIRRKSAAVAGAVGFALLGLMMVTGDSASAFGKACTMASGTVLGNVDISSEDPSVCIRRQVPGPVVPGLDSCHTVAFTTLGCTSVYTPSGPFKACTMGAGKLLGNVYVSAEDPLVCIRRQVPGKVPPGLDSCHKVASSTLGCSTVYTGS